MSENQPTPQPEQPEEMVEMEEAAPAADDQAEALAGLAGDNDDEEPEFAPGLDEDAALAEQYLADDVDDMPEITVNPAAFGPVMPKMNGNGKTASLDMLLDIGLQVTVELGRAKMTIKDVLSLGPGTVVELNRIAGEPVDILINDKPIAKGEVVVIGDMFGVRVTDIIPPAARVQSML